MEGWAVQLDQEAENQKKQLALERQKLEEEKRLIE